MTTARPRPLLATLVVLCVNTGFVGSLGVPLVHLQQAAYGVSLGHAQWSATIALLVGAVATPVIGRLGGARSGRAVILVALGLMTIGCALSVAQAGYPLMLVGRGLQGVGMGLTPMAITAARLALPAAEYQRVVGTLAVSTVAGAGLSFPATTAVASVLDLHAAFVLGTLLAGSTWLLAAWAIPELGTANQPRPLDVLGGVLLTGTVTSALLVITQGQHWGWASGATLAAATGAVVLGVLLVRWEHGRRDPFVDLDLVVRAPSSYTNVIGMFVGVGAYAALALASLRVQAPVQTGYGLGRSAFVAGTMIVPFSLTSIAANRVALALRPRVGSERLLALASFAAAGALALMALPWHSLPAVAAIVGLSGLATGCSFSLMPLLVSEQVAAHQMGSAMSMNQLLRYIGFAAGGALAVAVLEMGGSGDPTLALHQRAALVCAVLPAVGGLLGLWSARGRHQP